MSKKFISYEESIKRIKPFFSEVLGNERVFLSESLGRVLASNVVASFNSPAYETSAMDGYAIKHEDQKLGRLKILDDLPAGTDKKETVIKGCCIKTFTGSLMSDGSDTLIPIENVEVEGDEVVIKEEVPFGYSVRPVGENFKQNEVLIKKGAVIDFAEIGVMASLNIAQVDVVKKPRVSVLATGSEILEVGEESDNPSQIRSSNHFTLEAIAKKEGAEVFRPGVVGDDKDEIKGIIAEAVQSSDIVVTTGGVSVGDYDFVKDIIKEIEPQYIFDGVFIKPGQHIKAVKIGKKYIFALPGFPYSSTVTFILYIVPLIRSMLSLEDELTTVEATLKDDYKKKSKKTEFAAANISFENGEYFMDFQGKRSGSSAILTNMLGNVALIEIAESHGDLKKGDTVKAILLK